MSETPHERIELVARPRPIDLVTARFGWFLQGKWLVFWIAASGAFFVGWVFARARHVAIPAHLALPVLLLLVSAPLLVVFTGVGSKRAKMATSEGVRVVFDDDGVTFDGEHRTWRALDDVFEIGALVVLVDRGAVHVVPRKAFETKPRLLAFRKMVRAGRIAARRGGD